MHLIKLLAVSTCCLLAGCVSKQDLENRYGAGPIASKSEFDAAAKEQAGVIDVLVQATAEPIHKPILVSDTELAPKSEEARIPWPTTSAGWYAVTVTGFNVVDEGCDSYLRTIFKFDREKDRFTAAMLFADKATGAILTVSKVAPATVQVVSQAFGLGGNFGASIADSYLYKVRPAAVAGVVGKMRETFRASIEAAMLDPKKSEAEKPIRSAGTAFMAIREYRSLCYPETIEAKIEDMLAAANGDVKDGKKTKKNDKTSKGVTPATTAAPQVILTTQ